MADTSDWEAGFTAAVPPHFELCLKYGRAQKRKAYCMILINACVHMCMCFCMCFCMTAIVGI